MSIFSDIQYCLCWHRVGGSEKAQKFADNIRMVPKKKKTVLFLSQDFPGCSLFCPVWRCSAKYIQWVSVIRKIHVSETTLDIVLVDEIDDFVPKETPENYKIIRILGSILFNLIVMNMQGEEWRGR